MIISLANLYQLKKTTLNYSLFSLLQGIRQMEKSGLSFAKRDGLGYLTFCPSNLGTALRASVHIKIPKLSATPEFKAFCDNLHIQARGLLGTLLYFFLGVFKLMD